MKAVLKQGKNKKWHWVIVASNGQVLCTSEVYSSKTKCIQTFNKIVEALKKEDVVLQGETK